MVKETPFAHILGMAFEEVAKTHGFKYPAHGAVAWGFTGAVYLGHILCGYPIEGLRRAQYEARTKYGPVILDCKWYDALKRVCLCDNGPTFVMLPAASGDFVKTELTEELFIEMLDFCRDG